MNRMPPDPPQVPAVRVVRASVGHAPLMVQFYLGLSAATRYERFFSHRPAFTEEELHRFSHVDHSAEVCVIALARDAGNEIVVGEARCVTSRDGSGRYSDDGEVAVVVADGWRHRGIGRALMCALIASARAARFQGMFAYVTATNAGMMSLIREFEFRAQAAGGDAGMRLLRKDLTARDREWLEPGCREVARARGRAQTAAPAEA